MTIYYSPSKEGFYDTEIVSYTSLPEDIIEITKEQRDKFLHEMNNNRKRLVLNGTQLVLENQIEVVTWESVRDKRNGLLDNSDFTQIPDYTGDKKAWSVYRQQLRDLPQKYAKPEDVIWPKKPN